MRVYAGLTRTGKMRAKRPKGLKGVGAIAPTNGLRRRLKLQRNLVPVGLHLHRRWMEKSLIMCFNDRHSRYGYAGASRRGGRRGRCKMRRWKMLRMLRRERRGKSRS